MDVSVPREQLGSPTLIIMCGGGVIKYMCTLERLKKTLKRMH